MHRSTSTYLYCLEGVLRFFFFSFLFSDGLLMRKVPFDLFILLGGSIKVFFLFFSFFRRPTDAQGAIRSTKLIPTAS